MVVGEPPLTHEECAILTVQPPIPDNLRATTLDQIVELVNEEAGTPLITESEISILGVGLVTCRLLRSEICLFGKALINWMMRPHIPLLGMMRGSTCVCLFSPMRLGSSFLHSHQITSLSTM